MKAGGKGRQPTIRYNLSRYIFKWAIHTPPMDEKCPGGYFEPCSGVSRTDFNERKGVSGANVIVYRGESITMFRHPF